MIAGELISDAELDRRALVQMGRIPEVAIGQIWKDCDERAGVIRLLLVIGREGSYAVCQRCNRKGTPVTTRKVRIRITRMRPTSTGYVFIRLAGTDSRDSADVQTEGKDRK